MTNCVLFQGNMLYCKFVSNTPTLPVPHISLLLIHCPTTRARKGRLDECARFSCNEVKKVRNGCRDSVYHHTLAMVDRQYRDVRVTEIGSLEHNSIGICFARQNSGPK